MLETDIILVKNCHRTVLQSSVNILLRSMLLVDQVLLGLLSPWLTKISEAFRFALGAGLTKFR